MPDELRQLDGLDFIRLRVGMYIGGNDKKALHVMILQLLEAMVVYPAFGQPSKISVILQADGSIAITAANHSIPITDDPQLKISTLEKILSGVYFGRGPNTLRYVVLNALSSEFTAQTSFDGYLWQQDYKQGIPQDAPYQIRPLMPNEESCLTLISRPDAEIFDSIEFEFGPLGARLRELSSLAPNLNTEIRDDRTENHQYAHSYASSLLSLLITPLLMKQANKRVQMLGLLHQPIEGNLTFADDNHIEQRIEIALAYTTQLDFNAPIEKAFCNTILNLDGGTHLSAFRAALTRQINRFCQEKRMPKLYSQRIRKGLIAAVSVYSPYPQYLDASKSKFIRDTLYAPIFRLTTEAIQNYFNADPAALDRVIDWLQS
ncbi:MAG: hypothetical protein KF726_07250 [Anaerolineae bacterium]|nr:hypothetical protein [Anaerolineae bacterium]